MSERLQGTLVMDVPDEPAWPAVVSLALGVFSLVTAEFLPASLLTPMAAALHVSQGVAGQAVTATATVALIAGLLAAVVTRGLDRRLVLIGFSVMLIASDLLVATARDLPALLMARVLLGIALGGFWSMATAVAMRLVPETLVPRALSLVFSGVSAATIVAVPMGSYLGSQIGWRSVFLLGALIGLVTLLFQLVTLPRLPATGAARLSTLVHVLLRPRIGIGMVCTVLVFTGHFSLFTYIRPFLQGASGISTDGLSLLLLGFGLANFFGTFLAGFLVQRDLRATLALMPLLIGLAGLLLASGIGGLAAEALLIALWGMAFGGVPVAWSTWLSRTVPDEPESGGGLIVAAVQLAIATGAASGGAIFDLSGARGVFLGGGALLALTAGIVALGVANPKHA
jgi:predicted MFS family arabinose efflux permease